MHYDSTTSNEETEDSDNSSYPFVKNNRNRYKVLPSAKITKNDSIWKRFKSYFLLTPQQKLVLKCSFAYILGCLFTFVPELNALIGYNRVSSHLVATATVFFNPAKSLGGMVEAALYGWGYVTFALLICIGSMFTTDYFVDLNYITVAHIISLGFWLAGSTFVIAFLKAHWNKPPVATGMLSRTHDFIFMLIFIYPSFVDAVN